MLLTIIVVIVGLYIRSGLSCGSGGSLGIFLSSDTDPNKGQIRGSKIIGRQTDAGISDDTDNTALFNTSSLNDSSLNTTTNPLDWMSKKVQNQINKHVLKLPIYWEGFDIPPSVMENWTNWLTNYYKMQSKLSKDENYPGQWGGDFPGGNKNNFFFHWPDNWLGLGHGFEGFPPHQNPPFSYAPVHEGLPARCYIPPEIGNCTKYSDKWAYHPYLDECIQFNYTGCNGNSNRFKTQKRCKKSCRPTKL